MNDLIGLVVYLIVAGLILWLAFWVIDQIPIPPPFNQVIRVILVVVAVLICIYALLGLIGQAPRLRGENPGAATVLADYRPPVLEAMGWRS